MWNEKDLQLHRVRQHALLREAERERLARLTRRERRSQSRTWRALSRLAALFL